MAQLELTMEQLPNRVTAEVLDLLEEQNNLIIAKLTDLRLTPWSDWSGLQLLLHRLHLGLYAQLCYLPTGTKASTTTVLTG